MIATDLRAMPCILKGSNASNLSLRIHTLEFFFMDPIPFRHGISPSGYLRISLGFSWVYFFMAVGCLVVVVEKFLNPLEIRMLKFHVLLSFNPGNPKKKITAALIAAMRSTGVYPWYLSGIISVYPAKKSSKAAEKSGKDEHSP